MVHPFKKTLKMQQTSWWENVQRKAMALDFESFFPTCQDESWKYTNLKTISQDIFEQMVDVDIFSTCTQEETLLGNYHIVVRDGYVSQDESYLPEDAQIINWKTDGVRSASLLKAIQKTLKYTEVSSPFVHLNTIYARQAIAIYLPPYKIVTKPIEVHYIQSSPAAGSAYTQLWVCQEAYSGLTLFERFYGQEGAKRLHHHTTRFLLGEKAQLYHYRFQNAPKKNHYAFYNGYGTLGQESLYQSVALQSGGNLHREEMHITLKGENAKSHQSGFVVGKQQHFDNYWRVDHLASHTQSHQILNQALSENTKGIFYGLVNIPEGVQSVEAHQKNKNILLSETAQSFARPQLNISSEDVVCTHGSTTGALEENILYYLKTRGISEEKAKSLLLEELWHVPLRFIKQKSIFSSLEKAVTRLV